MNWYAVYYFDGTTSCRHELQAHSAADAITCFETFRRGKKAMRVSCIEAPVYAAKQPAEEHSSSDSYGPEIAELSDVELAHALGAACDVGQGKLCALIHRASTRLERLARAVANTPCSNCGGCYLCNYGMVK